MVLYYHFIIINYTPVLVFYNFSFLHDLIENDRKKLDMDSADPQNRSEWREAFEKDLSKSPTLGRGSKMDMMMMMMMMILMLITIYI